jgi:hypothetical protein
MSILLDIIILVYYIFNLFYLIISVIYFLTKTLYKNNIYNI